MDTRPPLGIVVAAGLAWSLYCCTPPPTHSESPPAQTTRRLSSAEFRATFIAPMQDVTATAVTPELVAGYLSSIPGGDLEPHWLASQRPELIYRTAGGAFEHLLFPTQTKNVYLVVVFAHEQQSVRGHFLLDLNREYGLLTPPRNSP